MRNWFVVYLRDWLGEQPQFQGRSRSSQCIESVLEQGKATFDCLPAFWVAIEVCCQLLDPQQAYPEDADMFLLLDRAFSKGLEPEQIQHIHSRFGRLHSLAQPCFLAKPYDLSLGAYRLRKALEALPVSQVKYPGQSGGSIPVSPFSPSVPVGFQWPVDSVELSAGSRQFLIVEGEQRTVVQNGESLLSWLNHWSSSKAEQQKKIEA
ncbi:MAG: hypothetical protein R3194_04340, partial [Limnobacter sp.]|nr:hypothetical protein [Limnobacter sp.]